MGTLEELTNSKRRALKLMGVPPFLLPAQSAPEVVAAPATEVTPANPRLHAVDQTTATPDPVPQSSPPTATSPIVEPIRFDWFRGACGMLCVDQLANDRQIAAQDLVRYLDWRFGKVAKSVSKPVADTFQWPQLTATDAGPVRPLTVFFEKHAADPAWVVVDRYVAEQVLVHLPELAWPTLIVVDDISAALTDPQAKMALWQKLAG